MNRSTFAAAGSLFFVLLLAGCLGAADQAMPAAAANAATDGDRLVSVPLYAFDDIVAGVGPPHPKEQHGGLVEPLPVAREDAFFLPMDVVRLKIHGGPSQGTGMARIEIVAPDGRLVWASRDLTAVGVPGILSVGLNGQEKYMDLEALVPGEYRVLYRTGGVFQFALSVEAVVQAGP